MGYVLTQGVWVICFNEWDIGYDLARNFKVHWDGMNIRVFLKSLLVVLLVKWIIILFEVMLWRTFYVLRRHLAQKFNKPRFIA